MISKKNLNTPMHIHTHIKELLALNTVHVAVFLHTRTQQLRVAPDEKKIYSGCMCTFENKKKTIKLFQYEKNVSKYSLFELSTSNNSTYIDAHGPLHEYTCLCGLAAHKYLNWSAQL